MLPKQTLKDDGLVLLLSIETLVKTVWRKRDENFSSLISCIGFLFLHFFQLIFSFYALSCIPSFAGCSLHEKISYIS